MFSQDLCVLFEQHATCRNVRPDGASSDEESPKWFKCPCCTQKTAFNAVDMKVDLYACGWISQLKLLFDTNPASVEEEKNKDLQVTAEAFLDMGSARRSCQLFEEPTAEKNIAEASDIFVAALGEKKCGDKGQRKAIENALRQGHPIETLQAILHRMTEISSTEHFLTDGAPRRHLPLWGCSNKAQPRTGHLVKRCKPRHRTGRWTEDEDRRFQDALGAHSGDWKAIAKAVGSRTKAQCISHDQVWRNGQKKKSQSQTKMVNVAMPCRKRKRKRGENDNFPSLTVGSRVEIYWHLDKMYYPATIIARDNRSENVFTIKYDDGVAESIDLGKEKFRSLDDEGAAPITDASVESWTCTCGRVNAVTKKRCPMPCMKWKVGFYAQKTDADTPNLAEITERNNNKPKQKKTNVRDIVEADSGSRPTRGSEKQIMLSKVGVRSRVSIFLGA